MPRLAQTRPAPGRRENERRGAARRAGGDVDVRGKKDPGEDLDSNNVDRVPLAADRALDDGGTDLSPRIQTQSGGKLPSLTAGPHLEIADARRVRATRGHRVDETIRHARPVVAESALPDRLEGVDGSRRLCSDRRGTPDQKSKSDDGV
jgi:hypothetical protein